MSLKIARSLLLGSAACAAALLGLGATGLSQAQPYDEPAAATSSVGGVTVYAPRRERRAWDGSTIVNATATRVVYVDDLDLNTGYGRHIMRERIRHAAADACHELDMQWTQGLYPMPDANSADCERRAVRDAEASAQSVAYNDAEVSQY